MTAMVAPVCIENAELRLKRIPALCLEIIHHLAEVVCIHGKTHLPAVWSKLLLCQSGKALEHRNRCHLRLLQSIELRKVLLA